ncbi:hypothetical protein MPSEU_000557300 [Mayamaea pseudoterrestris]|nr:hypothetical protein MPSEU_000557300 [Mayamaea pseudoterrestris]
MKRGRGYALLSCEFPRQKHGCRRATQRFVSLESRQEEGGILDNNDASIHWKSQQIKQRTQRSYTKYQPKFRNLSSSQQKRRSVMTTAMAQIIEQHIHQAIDTLSSASSLSSPSSFAPKLIPVIPTIRECNAALARFGDDGDMLRSLKLFGKMRKLAKLQQQPYSSSKLPTLCPTLVTYSTLMSRSNRLSKPAVSLRLFRMLRNDHILPDTRACNILMNAYTKLKQLDICFALYQQMKHSFNEDAVATNRLLLDANASCTQQMKNSSVGGAALAGNVLLLDANDDCSDLKPNLVTFNTLLDACSKVGNLRMALLVKREMEATGIQPDVRSYTSLIATTAVTSNNAARLQYYQAESLIAGAFTTERKLNTTSESDYPQDPLSLAFALFEEMKECNVRPNGMTYTALIDAASKARRSDLALQGLRLMLRDKKEQEKLQLNMPGGKVIVLSNEVGAWTAAINACGKAGRWETALKLFYAMPNFGVSPNTVTCGCLTDSLLRIGRTVETLSVLKYMKTHGIAPSEVMYTSLMMRAERLAELEQHHGNKAWATSSRAWQHVDTDTKDGIVAAEDTTAIHVYTELMKSLVESTERGNIATPTNHGRTRSIADDSNTLLLKVFLVFQEMKSSGVQPDLASFNALLRACARVGDVNRAEKVLREILAANLVPDDTTWRQLLCATGKAGQSGLALSFWKQGVAFRKKRRVVDERSIQWTPSVESFSMLLSAHLYEASTMQDNQERARILHQFVALYEGLLLGDESLGMDRVNLDQVLSSQRTMLLILQGFVTLIQLSTSPHESTSLRKMTSSIVQLDSLQKNGTFRIKRNAAEALKMARQWGSETALMT